MLRATLGTFFVEAGDFIDLSVLSDSPAHVHCYASRSRDRLRARCHRFHPGAFRRRKGLPQDGLTVVGNLTTDAGAWLS
jgi:hypothetical protein